MLLNSLRKVMVRDGLHLSQEIINFSHKSKHNKEIPRPGHSEPSGIRATYLPNRSIRYYHNIRIYV